LILAELTKAEPQRSVSPNLDKPIDNFRVNL